MQKTLLRHLDTRLRRRANKSVNRSWLAFRCFNVLSFAYNSRFVSGYSVRPPTRLPQTLAQPIREHPAPAGGFATPDGLSIAELSGIIRPNQSPPLTRPAGARDTEGASPGWTSGRYGASREDSWL